jgi:hypothetical protein
VISGDNQLYNPVLYIQNSSRINILFKGLNLYELENLHDIEAAQMIAPRLTTIRVQREQLGFEAVDFLIRKIDYGGGPSKISIYGELIERDSCKPIRS